MLCEYGCGQEAKYQLKNGKWICSRRWNMCPIIIEKITKKCIGQKRKPHSEETKQKLSEIRNLTTDLIKNSGILCEYGCGREAKYPPRKGKPKWTCEIQPQKCPVNKQKYSWGKGQKHLIEILNPVQDSGILCEYGCGREAKYTPGKRRKKWCCELHPNACPKAKAKVGEKSKGRHMSKVARKRMSEAKTGEKNPMYGKKRTIKYIQEKYPLFYKIEEMREDPVTGDIQAHCKNHKCLNSKEKGGWFTLTSRQIEQRISNLENDNDGCYFYCCEKCKHECKLFNKSVAQLIKEYQIKAGLVKELPYTSEEYNTWREEVLKRADYKCEYCGEKATHCHHIRPQKLEPFFSLDPDWGVATCSKCHYKYGHPIGTECSTGNLAKVICI
jgi:hypothetical protein